MLMNPTSAEDVTSPFLTLMPRFLWGLSLASKGNSPKEVCTRVLFFSSFVPLIICVIQASFEGLC